MKKNNFIKNDIKSISIDNEYIVLSLTTDMIFKLNETASFILKCMNNKISKNNIVKAVTKKHKISNLKAKKDVNKTLNFFLKEKLIKKI